MEQSLLLCAQCYPGETLDRAVWESGNSQLQVNSLSMIETNKLRPPQTFKLAPLLSCRTGDKCVLHFKPCGMFGKELHKVEGYIQDKRCACPPVSSAPSFHSVTCPFTPPCPPFCPVKRSTASSMGSGRSACGAWSRRCTRPTRNWRKRETRS